MNFFTSVIDDQAMKNVHQVLYSEKISEGEWVDRFEQEFNRTFGFKNTVLVNSGTSALHLVLEFLGIKEGDEVIIPSQTFVATGLAVLYTGAKVVFTDINVYGNIDPYDVEKRITNKTKAIIAVHWGGYPCDLEELQRICRKHKIVLIEDAAHALGASYKDEKIGNHGDFVVFSFQAIKHLTTGDGGAIVCKNLADYNDLKRLRWFGIDRENDRPNYLGERVYNLSEVGYKYHMNNIQAAIGLGNIEKFYDRLKHIRKLARVYDENLDGVLGLKKLIYRGYSKSSYWLYTVLLDTNYIRRCVIEQLHKNNIPSSVVHLGIHKNDIFNSKNVELSGQKRWDDGHLCLPIHSRLKEEEIYNVCKVLKEG